ncbi:MAG: Na/Pi symporter [Minisyncoccia bacterium]
MLALLSSIFGAVGSLALFIFSILSFDRLIRKHTSSKIKELLTSLTSNPVKGLIFGFITSAIIQSSSALTTLLASLADAGMISIYNSLGVIFGANIGTTITAQLIAFNFASISPLIIIIGVIFLLWGGRFRNYGKPIIYFGLLFFSIYLISYFVSKVDSVFFIDYIALISNLYIAIFVGIIASTLSQSSSVVTGIVLVMAGMGHFDLMQSVGLILGANIGTTTTVLIASLVMGKEAKKVAVAQFLFNFLGVIIVLPIINIFYYVVDWLDGDIVHQVANIHLLFNVFCAAVFIIAIKPFAWLVNRIVK